MRLHRPTNEWSLRPHSASFIPASLMGHITAPVVATLLFLWAPTASAYSITQAYALTPSPTYSGVLSDHSYNPTEETPNSVIRTGVGVYRVLLPGTLPSDFNPETSQPLQGNIQVVAFNEPGDDGSVETTQCHLWWWYPYEPEGVRGLDVIVKCMDPHTHEMRDSRFVVWYLHATRSESDDTDSPLGYAHVACHYQEGPCTLHDDTTFFSANETADGRDGISAESVDANTVLVTLPPNLPLNSVVSVTPVADSHCNVSVEGEVARVQCFGPPRTDGRWFHIRFASPTSPLDAVSAYAYGGGHSSPGAVVPTHEYSPTDIPGQINRGVPAGRYDAIHSGIIHRASATSDIAMVTAHAQEGEDVYCKLTGWHSSPDAAVGVACFSLVGEAVDAAFYEAYRREFSVPSIRPTLPATPEYAVEREVSNAEEFSNALNDAAASTTGMRIILNELNLLAEGLTAVELAGIEDLEIIDGHSYDELYGIEPARVRSQMGSLTVSGSSNRVRIVGGSFAGQILVQDPHSDFWTEETETTGEAECSELLVGPADVAFQDMIVAAQGTDFGFKVQGGTRVWIVDCVVTSEQYSVFAQPQVPRCLLPDGSVFENRVSELTVERSDLHSTQSTLGGGHESTVRLIDVDRSWVWMNHMTNTRHPLTPTYDEMGGVNAPKHNYRVHGRSHHNFAGWNVLHYGGAAIGTCQSGSCGAQDDLFDGPTVTVENLFCHTYRAETPSPPTYELFQMNRDAIGEGSEAIGNWAYTHRSAPFVDLRGSSTPTWEVRDNVIVAPGAPGMPCAPYPYPEPI